MALLHAQLKCRELDVHAHSVPQSRPPAGVMPVQDLAAALLIFASPQLRLGQLLDVVDHAIQMLLRAWPQAARRAHWMHCLPELLLFQ